jgi:hypothetical protein
MGLYFSDASRLLHVHVVHDVDLLRSRVPREILLQLTHTNAGEHEKDTTI